MISLLVNIILWSILIFLIFINLYKIWQKNIKYKDILKKNKEDSEYDSIKFILKDFFNIDNIENNIISLSYQFDYMTEEEIYNTLLEMTALEISIYYPSFLEIYTSYEEEINEDLTTLINSYHSKSIFLLKDMRQIFKENESYIQNLDRGNSLDFANKMNESMLSVLYEDIIWKVFQLQYNILEKDFINRKKMDKEAAKATKDRLLKGLKEDSDYYKKIKEGTSPFKE